MREIIALFIAATVLFTACNNGASNNPKEVLVHFFDALSKKDIAEAKKYTTKDSEGMMNMIQMGMNSAGNTDTMNYDKSKLDISDAVIDGDKATISVKDKMSGEGTEFVLKNENGSWKVAFDKSTMMDMAQKKMKEKGQEMPNIDSEMNKAMDELKNMSAEDREKAMKMVDSASKIFEEMKASGQLQGKEHLLDSASELLKKLNVEH